MNTTELFALILLIAWVVGLSMGLVGNFIHLLLVVAVFMFLYGTFQRSTA